MEEASGLIETLAATGAENAKKKTREKKGENNNFERYVFLCRTLGEKERERGGLIKVASFSKWVSSKSSSSSNSKSKPMNVAQPVE